MILFFWSFLNCLLYYKNSFVCFLIYFILLLWFKSDTFLSSVTFFRRSPKRVFRACPACNTYGCRSSLTWTVSTRGRCRSCRRCVRWPPTGGRTSDRSCAPRSDPSGACRCTSTGRVSWGPSSTRAAPNSSRWSSPGRGCGSSTRRCSPGSSGGRASDWRSASGTPPSKTCPPTCCCRWSACRSLRSTSPATSSPRSTRSPFTPTTLRGRILAPTFWKASNRLHPVLGIDE